MYCTMYMNTNLESSGYAHSAIKQRFLGENSVFQVDGILEAMIPNLEEESMLAIEFVLDAAAVHNRHIDKALISS